MKRLNQQRFLALTLSAGLTFYAVSSLEGPLGGVGNGPPNSEELEISLPIGQFEDGVDTRGSLARLLGGPDYSGPFYAWNTPYDSQDAHDDINYWDVISDGDGADEFVDYHFRLQPPQDWSIFDRLKIDLFADDGEGGDGPTGAQVYIHDADGIGNNQNNGYHFLGSIGSADELGSSVNGIYELSFGDADQRDEIDDVLIRVRESYFEGVYTASQQRTYLSYIDAYGTTQNPQEPVFLGAGIVDPNDISYLYAPSVMYDEKEGLFKYWACGTFTKYDHILYKEAGSIEGLKSAPLTVALYPAQFDGGDGTEFDYKHVCDPNVIRVGSVYYLYYGALGGDSLPPEERATAIGVATSTDGGRTFTRRKEPIVALLPGDFVPGSYGIGQPAVVQEAQPEGNFYMVYTQQDGYSKQMLVVIRSAEPDFSLRDEEFQRTAQAFSWSVDMVYDASKYQFIVVHNYTDVDDLGDIRVVMAHYDTSFRFLASMLAQKSDAGFAFGEGVALVTDSAKRLGWDDRDNLTFMGATYDPEWTEPWPPARILGPHMQTTFRSIDAGQKGK